MGSPRSINQAFDLGTKIQVDAIVPNTSPLLIIAHAVGSTSYQFCKCVIGQKELRQRRYYVIAKNGNLRESSLKEIVSSKKRQLKKAAPRKKNDRSTPQAM